MNINTTHTVTPKGKLEHLTVDDIKRNSNNPRRLFDPEPLKDLKESIEIHGVLVPLTVYELPGQKNKYTILDGERRFRSCELIEEERKKENHEKFERIDIPANIVNPPDKISNLLYMFSIHNFREEWELMPTALSLRAVIEELKLTKEEHDNKKLAQLTGLSETIVERCKWLLSFPKEFQLMSLDPDPKTRIPSNFWIEAYPVIEIYKKHLPSLIQKLGEEQLLLRLVNKYRDKKIVSVIHFRRIREAFSNAKEDSKEKTQEVLARLEEYIDDPELETRAAFDEFLRQKQVKNAVTACNDFMKKIQILKIELATENRAEITKSLSEVRKLIDNLLKELEGRDDPATSRSTDKEK